MSYNLMAEGDLDLFELAEAATQYNPLELFPIPAGASSSEVGANHRVKFELDGLGIAIPSSRIGPEAVAALHALVKLMWSKDASVFDLQTGKPIATLKELAQVEEYLER
ncbi:hypothetical protein LVJ94_51550 [Pendulispora rubella]|uniref:Uncharacterized protein n=1 Tax=Pendulispora rubella TaxID=2741070 RepID=A0ABZ2L9D6_9BACT